jgi:hypothetical protein
MNYDLAIMALEGLARSPLQVRTDGDALVIEASSASFKELARLCLLLGGVQSAEDEFELQQGVHVSGTSPQVKLRLLSS